MNDNLLTQMIYRIVTCCVSALAVLLTFRFFHNFYGSSALWEFALSLDDLDWGFLKYYTNLSNWFVFGVSVTVLADNVKRVRAGERYGYNRVIPALKFATTVMIFVTFAVYNFSFESVFALRYWRNLYNLTCHLFAPLLFVFDFVIFDEHGTAKAYYPLVSLILPLTYVAGILIVGACVEGFGYPYAFLDVNRFGYAKVFLFVSALVAVFTLVGYLMWLYNRLVRVDGKWRFRLRAGTCKNSRD